MQDIVITRVQYSGPPRRSRNIEERLMVRFPSLYRRLAGLAWRLLNPRSRLRRAFLRRQLVSGWAAGGRRDFELVVVRYARDVVVDFDPGFQTLGVGEKLRGHGAMVEAHRAVWEQLGARAEPSYVVDLGDRLLCLGYFRTHAPASGVKLERELAQLLTIREGLVSRHQAFLAWDEGLRAAGLEPDLFHPRLRPKADRAASSPS
jgi:hypothetical protein